MNANTAPSTRNVNTGSITGSVYPVTLSDDSPNITLKDSYQGTVMCLSPSEARAVATALREAADFKDGRVGESVDLCSKHGAHWKVQPDNHIYEVTAHERRTFIKLEDVPLYDTMYFHKVEAREVASALETAADGSEEWES